MSGSGEREARIRELLPLVRQIARRVSRIAPGADQDDLVGDGSIGLIRAVDTYDPSRGTIEGYARTLILGNMFNGMRRLDPVSERVRRTLRRAETRRLELAQQRGSMPTLAEMDRADPALKRARAVVYRHTPLSLDAPLPVRTEVLADRTLEPSAHAVARAKTAELFRAIGQLSERQQCIVTMHYFGEQPLHAIGAHLRISPQRVSQLHVAALERLRRTAPAP